MAGPGHRRCSTSAAPRTPTSRSSGPCRRRPASSRRPAGASDLVRLVTDRRRRLRASAPASATSRRSWSTWPPSTPPGTAACDRPARPAPAVAAGAGRSSPCSGRPPRTSWRRWPRCAARSAPSCVVGHRRGRAPDDGRPARRRWSMPGATATFAAGWASMVGTPPGRSDVHRRARSRCRRATRAADGAHLSGRRGRPSARRSPLRARPSASAGSSSDWSFLPPLLLAAAGAHLLAAACRRRGWNVRGRPASRRPVAWPCS